MAEAHWTETMSSINYQHPDNSALICDNPPILAKIISLGNRFMLDIRHYYKLNINNDLTKPDLTSDGGQKPGHINKGICLDIK